MNNFKCVKLLVYGPSSEKLYEPNKKDKAEG